MQKVEENITTPVVSKTEETPSVKVEPVSIKNKVDFSALLNERAKKREEFVTRFNKEVLEITKKYGDDIIERIYNLLKFNLDNIIGKTYDESKSCNFNICVDDVLTFINQDDYLIKEFTGVIKGDTQALESHDVTFIKNLLSTQMNSLSAYVISNTNSMIAVKSTIESTNNMISFKCWLTEPRKGWFF
jgi:hypothetical protein